MDEAPRRRALRSDAAANRQALLATAARIVRDRGPAVPLAEVAAEAGVGIGTLYRHFPDRDALLAALARSAQDVLLALAREAAALADAGATPREAIAGFLEAAVRRREELVSSPGDSAVVEALAPLVRRGVTEGSLRHDATAPDVVVAAALLAPVTAVADARRHLVIFLDGLGGPPAP